MKTGFDLRVQNAVESVRMPGGCRPRYGVILGSGLGGLVDRVEGEIVPYEAIRGFPRPTVAGHRGLVKLGSDTAVLAGRFHYYEGHDPDDVVLPVFFLHGLGVRTLIITNAAGGIREGFEPGDLVLIRDHINLMGWNALRGPHSAALGPRFPDMSAAYTPDLRTLARETAAGTPGRAQLEEGVYAALPGPSYETPAEIRMLRALGADLVGMSTVPEVTAARFLGLDVLGVSCVTNLAAGISDAPLSHEEVMETGRRSAAALEELILGVLEGLRRSGTPRRGPESTA